MVGERAMYRMFRPRAVLRQEVAVAAKTGCAASSINSSLRFVESD
jgi:hypothetical protein